MIAKQKVHSFKTAFDYNHKKTMLADPKERAELLDHNFIKYDRNEVFAEIDFLKSLRPRLKNDGYHVALSFAKEDILDNSRLISIAHEYMKGMGFDPDVNYYALWKHNDGEDHEHSHVHLLLSRIGYRNGKATVVSDSNNYQRSEVICRNLEKQYGLTIVKSSKDVLERAPNKDELEMIQRTGMPSERMLLQEKVKMALEQAESFKEFIDMCNAVNVYLLFNQSNTTGRVSGITYITDTGFIAKGQKLGNLYKWNNIKETTNYEQSRDGEIARQANSRTRGQVGAYLDQISARTARYDRQAYSRSISDYGQSSGFREKDSENIGHTLEGRSKSYFTEINGGTASEQEVEDTVANNILDSASSAIAGITGLLGAVSPNEKNDDESHRKRKRKR